MEHGVDTLGMWEATAAADAASTVSSVLPENEMAKTSDPSPTNAGTW